MPTKTAALSIFVTHGGILTIKLASNHSRKIRHEVQVCVTFEKGIYHGQWDREGFAAHINQIKQEHAVDPHRVMVCCDANLGQVAGPEVTHEVDWLLRTTGATHAYLFTDSTTNAAHYLNRERMANGIQLPEAIKSHFVCARAELMRSLSLAPYAEAGPLEPRADIERTAPLSIMTDENNSFQRKAVACETSQVVIVKKIRLLEEGQSSTPSIPSSSFLRFFCSCRLKKKVAPLGAERVTSELVSQSIG
jgi:hypothetical protein